MTGFSQLHDDGTGGVSANMWSNVLVSLADPHQSIPLSLFKVFPFASCGNNDLFEECPTSLDGRKVLRKVLEDGMNLDYRVPSGWLMFLRLTR